MEKIEASEPGRKLKTEKYRRLRREQKQAERALGELTIGEALGSDSTEKLILIKDRLEQAAGIIRGDLKESRSSKM